MNIILNMWRLTLLLALIAFVAVSTENAHIECPTSCYGKKCNECDGYKCCKKGKPNELCGKREGCKDKYCCWPPNCWRKCGSKGGLCDYCNNESNSKEKRKACCRYEFGKDPLECRDRGCKSYHCCVPANKTKKEICESGIDDSWKISNITVTSNINKCNEKILEIDTGYNVTYENQKSADSVFTLKRKQVYNETRQLVFNKRANVTNGNFTVLLLIDLLDADSEKKNITFNNFLRRKEYERNLTLCEPLAKGRYSGLLNTHKHTHIYTYTHTHTHTHTHTQTHQTHTQTYQWFLTVSVIVILIVSQKFSTA